MSPEDRRLRAFPLAFATRGQRLLVAALEAEKRLTKRLGDLGLRRGAEIEVVHSMHAWPWAREPPPGSW
jgi:Fe2+ transport system protein FeoA